MRGRRLGLKIIRIIINDKDNHPSAAIDLLKVDIWAEKLRRMSFHAEIGAQSRDK